MNSKWILNINGQPHECTSFPYAFRTAYNVVRKQIEAGKPTGELLRSISIVGPVGHPSCTNLSYGAATQKATDMGLLTPDGQINSREFKRRF